MSLALIAETLGLATQVVKLIADGRVKRLILDDDTEIDLAEFKIKTASEMLEEKRKAAGVPSAAKGAVCLLFAIVLCGCNEFRNAVRVAQESQTAYTALAETLTSEIVRLEQKQAAGTLTPAESEVLPVLLEAVPAFDAYAESHNAYVDALAIWQAARKIDRSAPMPGSLIPLLPRVIEFGKQANKVRKALKRLTTNE